MLCQLLGAERRHQVNRKRRLIIVPMKLPGTPSGELENRRTTQPPVGDQHRTDLLKFLLALGWHDELHVVKTRSGKTIKAWIVYLECEKRRDPWDDLHPQRFG